MPKFLPAFLIAFIIILQHDYLDGQSPNIILGRPTNKAITVSVLFDNASSFYIRYGTKSGQYDQQSATFNTGSGVPVRVEISDLFPDTKYYYILQYKKSGDAGFNTSPEYSFQTQRSPGSSFTVTIEADEHLYDKKGVKSLYEICLANQAKDNPDFMISMGDTFGDDHTPTTTTSDDMKQLHLDYIPFLSKICHSIPFFFCVGNHEGENGYYLKQNNGQNICVYGTQWRKYYFANPYPNGFYTGNMKMEGFGIGLPENYYAFVWGDAHFIVLDVYRHCDESEKPQKWNWTLGETQYQWFKNTLETSTSKYKFVLAHHTRGQGRGGINTARAYEWGGYNGDNGNNYEFDTYRPGWGLPIHQLMVKHGVNIFFQGHDHLYAKEDLDGIVYQEVPMPSDTTYEIGVLANADAYKGITLNGSGHIRLNITPSEVTVDYIRAYLPKDTLSGLHKNREVAHSYKVQANTSFVGDHIYTNQTLEIFPNPVDQMIHVRLLANQNVSKVNIVELVDMQGNVLIKNDISGYDEMHQLNVSNKPDGIYIVKYRHDFGIVSKKVVINH